MIRVQSFDSDNMIPVMSGLLTEETSADSYVFVNTLLKLLPPEEAIQETYLILRTLEQFYTIYSRSKLIPSIDKEKLLITIRNNIYEELKENKRAGFREYARDMCQIELDLFNEETLGQVADVLLTSIENIFDQAIELGYTLNGSVSELLNFQTNYKHALVQEAGRLLEMLSNSDMSQVNIHFWGWSFFLRRYKIYSVNDAATLLNLISDFIRTKDKWSMFHDSPLNSIDDLLALQELYLENMTPFMATPFEAFNSCIQFKRRELSVLVAAKSAGKTTFASMIAGIALNQNLKVLFYSPETNKEKMLFENILPPYIRAKYGFAVTTPQVLGLEEPFEAGSEYTAEEKKVIIKIARQELVDSANFMHVGEYYMYKTMEEDMRAHVKTFSPDIVVIDHTQEIRGEAGHNEKTSRLATTMKSIVKDYDCHGFILSHPGVNFAKAVPTLENPISRDVKIAAWSNDIETLADNIMGALKVGNNEFKIFYTKLRNGEIPPMFQTFRMIKPQGWFEFRPEDQYVQNVDTSAAIEALVSGQGIRIDDDIEFDEDWD